MKQIYIAPFLHMPGGLERTLSDKANYLVDKGHEILLLTYAQGKEKMFYSLDWRVKHVDIDTHLFSMYHIPLLYRVWSYIKIRRQFRKRFRKVLIDFCPDLIVITIPNTEDFIADMVDVCRECCVKIAVECHLAAAFYMEGKPVMERMLCRMFPPIKAIRKSDLLIALTESDADYFRNYGVKNVLVVPNPVSFYDETCYSNTKIEGRIISVGRFFSQKRFDRLIDAFSLIANKYPGWYIDIFGKGPLEKSYVERINELGLNGRVNLLPPTKNIVSEYRKSQFFVLASDYEGFGLVIVESMACGLPVVATDCPYGPSEIIDDDEMGLLARMDVQNLAEKMEWMITHPEERKLMGQKAHLAAARYRKEIVIPEWERAYMSVIK